MSDLRCVCCGLLTSGSDWCMETRDGDHRPVLMEAEDA